MATTPTPIPDPTLTPELQKLQAEIAAAQASPPEPTPEEVKLELATGQIYKGKTWEEVARAEAQAQEHSSAEITRLRAELAARNEPPPPPAPDDTYNHETYLKLLESDGRAATRYAMGYDPTIQKVLGTVDQVQERITLSQFTAQHPSYPVGDEAAAATLFSYMEEKGRSATVDDMSLSYFELREQGRIKAVTPSAEGYVRPNIPPQPRTNSAPTPDVNAVVDEFRNMTADQMKAQLRKLGMRNWE